MSSWKEEGEDLGSLFEGMVLIDPISQTSAAAAEQEEEEVEDDDVSYLSSPRPSISQQQQQPLDENLFSDLTLVQTTPAPESIYPDSHASLPARQTSTRRKKRGGIRIGYARADPDPDPYPDTPKLPHSPSPLAAFKIDDDGSTTTTTGRGGLEQDQPSLSYSNLHISHTQLDPPPPPPPDAVVDIERIPENGGRSGEQDSGDPCKFTLDSDQVEDAATQELPTMASQDPCTWIENKLEAIRSQISHKLASIRETASSVSTERKVAVKMKRKAADSFHSASLIYKDLEKELEEACEAEDFERAEEVSDKLAAAEKEREAFLDTLREAHVECHSVESKMQEVLELQITTEEEGASMLQRFATVN